MKYTPKKQPTGKRYKVLNAKKVGQIIKMAKGGRTSVSAIAKKFKVTPKTIRYHLGRVG